jgi:small-conductance mechanosensitive channel
MLEEVTPIEFQSQAGGSKTGALIWVNNSSIFREKMTNYTRGFPYIWCALTITVTYESDWKSAEGMLRTILESHDEILTTAKLARKGLTKAAADLAIKVDDTSPRIRAWPADSGISFRVRFMVHPRRRRAMMDAFNRQVIDAFMASPDIDFAYNTMRVIPTPSDRPD